jgi:hypothetical protein
MTIDWQWTSDEEAMDVQWIAIANLVFKHIVLVIHKY